MSKIYDFEGTELFDPVLVPQELADEILNWLEHESGRQRIFAQDGSQLLQS